MANTNTIILGDSVGRQLFGNRVLDKKCFKNSLTTNAATSMIGQYIFAYNALVHNQNIKYIVVAVVPHSLSLPFEHRQTYHGILKSFYTFENRKHFSQLVRSKMAKKPLSYFIIFPMIKIAKCFPDINFRSPGWNEGIKNRILSDTSIQYLKKLKDLLKKLKYLKKKRTPRLAIKPNTKNFFLLA